MQGHAPVKPATLEAEIWNSISLVPVDGSSYSVGGYVVEPSLIWHKERNLTKYWDLTET